MSEISRDVFITSATHIDHHYIFWLEVEMRQKCQCVATFESWYDSFKTCELKSCTKRFVIVDRQYFSTILVGKVRNERTDARIVQTC